jgi:hypothetical protein
MHNLVLAIANAFLDVSARLVTIMRLRVWAGDSSIVIWAAPETRARGEVIEGLARAVFARSGGDFASQSDDSIGPHAH